METESWVRHHEVSRRLGTRWRQLTQAEKEPHLQEAERLRLAHLQQHPGYRYQPRRRLRRAASSDKQLNVHSLECSLKAAPDTENQRKIHNAEDASHVCIICNKTAEVKRGSANHIRRVQYGEHPYICDVCSLAFTWKLNLDKHRRGIQMEKPHSCSICGDTFSQKNDLCLHMRSHTKKHHWRCFFCDRAYKWQSTLEKHVRVVHMDDVDGEYGDARQTCKRCLTRTHPLSSSFKHYR